MGRPTEPPLFRNTRSAQKIAGILPKSQLPRSFQVASPRPIHRRTADCASRLWRMARPANAASAILLGRIRIFGGRRDCCGDGRLGDVISRPFVVDSAMRTRCAASIEVWRESFLITRRIYGHGQAAARGACPFFSQRRNTHGRTGMSAPLHSGWQGVRDHCWRGGTALQSRGCISC